MVGMEMLSCAQVEKGVQALLQVLEKTKETKKTPLLSEDQLVNLQFTTKKVSKQQKIVKLKLPNGLSEEHKEVCLFVKDLDKTDREYEKSVRHFKAVLKTKGITSVSEIIPLKALKLEHKPFEAKRNLSNRFDVFLADARIIRLLPAYLGKAFFGKKRQPHQVRLDAKDLKAEFEAAVNNSRCILTGKGSTGLATVGSTRMSAAELVQNIMTSAQQIVEALPGGADNIRNFFIKTEDSLAIPVYASLGSANDITLPKTKPKPVPVLAEEVSTVIGATVKVYPRGAVKLIDEAGQVIKPRLKPKALKRAGRKGAKPVDKKVKGKAAGKQTGGKTAVKQTSGKATGKKTAGKATIKQTMRKATGKKETGKRPVSAGGKGKKKSAK